MKKIRLVLLVLVSGLILSLCACEQKLTPSPSPSAVPSQMPAKTSAPVPTEPLTGFLKSVGDKLGNSCSISGTTIKLNQNVKLADNAVLLLDSADNFTIDFNGHTITSNISQAGGAVIACTNGSLNLIDTSGGGGIILTSSTEAYALSCSFEGTMSLSGINVTSSLVGSSYQGIAKNRTGAYALQAKEGGKLTVNSGSYIGNAGLVVEYVRRKPAVLLNGGTFSGFVDVSGNTDLSAFLGSGKKAVKSADGKITVSNG